MATTCTFRVEHYASCAQELLRFRTDIRAAKSSAEYFDWRYGERPCREKALVVFAEDDRTGIIGCAGLIPHDFFMHDSIKPVGVIGDIAVHSAYRGRGVARAMLGYLLTDRRLEVLAGTFVLPNEQATPALLASGWIPLTSIRRRMRPLRGDIGSPTAQSRLTRSGRLVSAAIAGRLLTPRVPPRWTWDVHHTAEFDARFDELWSVLPKAGRILALRDAAYLSWRFGIHPMMRHSRLEIRHDGVLQGYAIFSRHETTITIDDFAVSGETAGKVLAAAVVDWTRSDISLSGIQVRECEPTWMPAAWRVRCGFFERPDRAVVLWNASWPGSRSLSAVSAPDWFVTPADKDV